MQVALTSRSLIVRALLAGLFAGYSAGMLAQHPGGFMVRRSPLFLGVVESAPPGQQQVPAPIERRPPPAGRAVNGAAGTSTARADGRRGEHLPEWMNQHRGMTLEQQQQALDREPGFRELPGPVQQRMHNRLAQLHAMAPLERQRMLADTEAMERLTLVQRSQVRGAMEQLGSLPPNQRRQVAQSFRELRLVPPEHRMEVMLYSGRYSWLNEAQRITLVHLIQVAPMLPQREPPQPRN